VKDRILVEVKWEDAWTDFQDVDLKRAKKLKPIPRTTVGWLVTENDKCVILCTDYYDKDKSVVNTPIVIPSGMITKLYKYDVIQTM
jgi:hypothetical protein